MNEYLRQRRRDRLNGDRLNGAIAGNLTDLRDFFLYGSLDANKRLPDKKPILHVMVRRGNTEGVRLLLDHGADPSLRDSGGRSALHIATRYLHVDIVRILLEIGAHVNAEDFSGRTPIFGALMHPDYDATTLLSILMQYGANIDVIDENGWSLLHVAAKYASHEPVELLLELGLDVNRPNHMGKIALDYAIRKNHADTVSALLKHSARAGPKQLYMAIEMNDDDIVGVLLNHGVDVNPPATIPLTKTKSEFASLSKTTFVVPKYMWYPLHNAVRHGHSRERPNTHRIVLILLAHGANLTIQDQDGRTPYDIANDMNYTVLKTGLASSTMQSDAERWDYRNGGSGLIRKMLALILACKRKMWVYNSLFDVNVLGVVLSLLTGEEPRFIRLYA